MTAQTQLKTFVDPVCGMSVDPATTAAKTCHNGVEIYFCARGCKKAFDAHPQKYTGSRKKKGFWKRYLDRLNKATGGKPPSCCS
ncbi:YHS domain-containing protein [uncultured Desulfosarcina sp.]|uniref:YHS domain-containing protein n=1 Tax=uncultured Desulfosarcina sp. TaxID=218289 RepID=UPI0029C93C2F|nr:YHS domain-containing protein [uncultured Desulfosarcina sp.]